jgi:hypothetical protein
MSETTAAAPTGQLFKALAQLQADLPKVGKAATGQYGRYADLADVSQRVLPQLGKLGLVFTSRPTIIDGSFVLAYSLVHVSGEREDGIYPLPSGGTPQQMGSAITYARRYCLCAVTGVAPDQDDDDATSAQHAGRPTAGNAFENSSPARPANGNGQQQGQVSRPAQAQPAEQPSADIDEAAIADWAAKIDEIGTAEDADRVDGELREVFKSGRMNPTTANAIRKAIRAKRDTTAQREKAGAS